MERADEDLVLVNTLLDPSARYKIHLVVCLFISMLLWKLKSFTMHGCTDGAAAVETLRSELAQAKEQVRVSQAAADKAIADLTA